MTREPKYYRARLQTLNEHIGSATDQEKRWLQNGFIPDADKDDFDMWIKARMHDKSNEPLTFTELTTYSTWYDMHPEKVAGTIQGGTSIYFPVIVKGTKADCEKMFADALANAPTPQPDSDGGDDELELLELEAEALEMELLMAKN